MDERNNHGGVDITPNTMDYRCPNTTWLMVHLQPCACCTTNHNGSSPHFAHPQISLDGIQEPHSLIPLSPLVLSPTKGHPSDQPGFSSTYYFNRPQSHSWWCFSRPESLPSSLAFPLFRFCATFMLNWIRDVEKYLAEQNAAFFVVSMTSLFFLPFCLLFLRQIQPTWILPS